MKQILLITILSRFGTSFVLIAQMAMFKQLSGSAQEWGFLAAAKALPILLIGLWIGNWIDSKNRRHTLVASEFLRALLTVSLGFVQDINVFYALVFMTSVFAVPFEPAIRSLTVSIVPSEKLFSMNSLNETIRGLCAVTGIMASGFLVTYLDKGTMFWIASCGHFAASAVLFFLPGLEQRKLESKASHVSLGQKLSEGWKWFQSNSVVHYPLIVWTALVFVIGFESPLFFPLMEFKEWGGAREAAFIIAFAAIGSLVTSLVLSRRQDSLIKSAGWLAIVLAFDAMAVLIVSETGVYKFAMLMGLVLGTTETFILTYAVTAIQKSVDEKSAGRVFAAISAIQEPTKVLALFLSGVIVQASSAQAGFRAAVGIEAALILLSLIVWIRGRRARGNF